MARIMIITSGGHHIGRLAIVAAVLKSRGHDVSLVGAGQPIEPAAPPIIVQTITREYECKPAIEWRKERDYPTLREGIRRKQIKKLRK